MNENRKNIKIILLFIIILTLLPVIIFKFVISEKLQTGVEKVLVQSNLQIGGRIALSLREFFKNEINSLKYLENMEEIKNLNPLLSKDILQFYRDRNDSCEFIVLVDIDGGYVSSYGIDQDVQAIIQNDICADRLSVIPKNSGGIITGKKSKDIFIIKTVLDSNENIIGYIISKLRMRKLKELIDSKILGTTEKLFIVDNKFQVIYGTDKNIPPTLHLFKSFAYGSYEYRKGNNSIVTVMSVVGFNLKIVIFKTYKKELTFLNYIIFDLMIWGFISVIISFLAGIYLFSKKEEKLKNEKRINEIPEDKVKKVEEEEISQYKFLYELSLLTNYNENIDEFLHIVLSKIIKFLSIERASIMMINNETDELELVAVRIFDKLNGNCKKVDFIKKISLFSGEGIAGKVFKSGKYIHVKNIENDERFKSYDSETGIANDIASLLVIPVKSNDITIGVINLVNPIDDKEFTSKEIETMNELGQYLGGIMEKVKMYQFVTTDDTTELFTEKYFKKSLELQLMKCRRYGIPISLLMVKIDDYEIIEKKFGEHVVSLIKKELSQLIKSLLKIGICTSLKNNIIILTEDNPESLAEIIIKKVTNKEFSTGGDSLKLTLNIGGLITTDHLMISSEILKKLEEILRLSVKKGVNEIVVEDIKNEENKNS